MTGPKENSEFCFPETLNVSRGSRGNKTLFPVGPVISVLLYIPPNSKIEKIYRCQVYCKRCTQICRGFKAHDLITCDLSRKFKLLFN